MDFQKSQRQWINRFPENETQTIYKRFVRTDFGTLETPWDKFKESFDKRLNVFQKPMETYYSKLWREVFSK